MIRVFAPGGAARKISIATTACVSSSMMLRKRMPPAPQIQYAPG
jgi:hypothetical protein